MCSSRGGPDNASQGDELHVGLEKQLAERRGRDMEVADRSYHFLYHQMRLRRKRWVDPGKVSPGFIDLIDRYQRTRNYVAIPGH